MMNKPKMHTPDLTKENIAKLAELFPHCVTESRDEAGNLQKAIDFDQLRQVLSDHVIEGPRERYHLNWPGKGNALLAANAPIAKTLRPCREESVGFDTTQHLFIEGDNLDALKLLQETYLNRVNAIYIDPPYNTGNDLIYDDDFAESIDGYLAKSYQRSEEGIPLVANPESKGRFHSDWLSMLYPRLTIAARLLSDDGVIFISIDDCEVANLRRMCDEIFGRDAWIATFVWKSRQNKDNRPEKGASIDHEYVLCYGSRVRGDKRNHDQYTNPDNDLRGPWASANMVGLATRDRRPNLHYDLIDPATRINYGCPAMGWRYDPTTMKKLIGEKRILWPSSPQGRPRRKSFLSELSSEFTGVSSIIGDGVFTRDGTSDITKLFSFRAMDFPKPVALIVEILQQAMGTDGVVLDFFAGSGTTAHAVMSLNGQDGGTRRYIMVQLREQCDEQSESFKSGLATIADIAKERIRRAGEQVKRDAGLNGTALDVGFRVLKVDSSCMKDVYYRPDQVKPELLGGYVDNIKQDRTDEDLLFQVLLDWGVDLSLPIKTEKVVGKNVLFVDENALAACFEPDIDEDFVKALATRKPLRAVFRDAGYGGDDVKINVEQIFKQLSPGTEVKTL